MSLQSPPAAAAGLSPGAELEQEQGSAAPPAAEEDGEDEEEEEEEGEKERDKLPPIPAVCGAAAGGLERGAKNQFSTFSNFITTINQKKEGTGNRNSPTQLVIPSIKNVRDLPPICLDVRQKQRISIDTLPQELKAPVPPEPSLPIRTKTVKDFQDDMEKAKSSGDWKAVHDFYSTTFDSFLEINAAFKKDANSPFNTTEDSGINAKFVNVVYDALLNTPQDVQKSVLKGIINGLLQEWKGPRTKDDLRAYCILLQQICPSRYACVDNTTSHERSVCCYLKISGSYIISGDASCLLWGGCIISIFSCELCEINTSEKWEFELIRKRENKFGLCGMKGESLLLKSKALQAEECNLCYTVNDNPEVIC